MFTLKHCTISIALKVSQGVTIWSFRVLNKTQQAWYWYNITMRGVLCDIVHLSSTQAMKLLLPQKGWDSQVDATEEMEW